MIRICSREPRNFGVSDGQNNNSNLIRVHATEKVFLFKGAIMLIIIYGSERRAPSKEHEASLYKETRKGCHDFFKSRHSRGVTHHFGILIISQIKLVLYHIFNSVLKSPPLNVVDLFRSRPEKCH